MGSEAIDAFGAKYLLGVFETKDEAKKAFADWNGEFEKARGEMEAELEQWGKQEQARLDRDTEARSASRRSWRTQRHEVCRLCTGGKDQHRFREFYIGNQPSCSTM